jgi:hypothetical protein
MSQISLVCVYAVRKSWISEVCHRNSESLCADGHSIRSSSPVYFCDGVGLEWRGVDGNLNLWIYHFETSLGGVRQSSSAFYSHAPFFSPPLLSDRKK